MRHDSPRALRGVLQSLIPRRACLLAVGLLHAAPEAVAGGLTRADVVSLALSEHPAVYASSLRADAARTAVDGEGAYEPLMLDVGLAPGTLAMRPGVQFSAGWTLPLWDMRGLARSAATRRADMADAAERMTRSELAAWTSIAVDDWLLAVERLKVLEHHQSTLIAVRETISRRVAADLAPPVAEAMARMAVLDLEEQRIVARRDLATAEAALAALAGVSPSDLSADILPLDAAPDTSGSRPSPTEEMALADIGMRTDMAEMARREGRPMVSPMVSLNTMWPDPMDWAMVGVGVDVPLDVRAIRARTAAAAEQRSAAEAALDTAQRDVAHDRADGLAMWRMATDMEVLMRTEGEPLAVERARLARSAWEANQAPVSEWLDAEKEVLEARWRIAEARAERSRAIAMIAMIDGQLIGLPAEAP